MNEICCLNCGHRVFIEKNGQQYCVRCGSKYNLRDDDQQTRLVAAYQKLQGMDFLEAEKDFENIIHDHPNLAEAYWGCACARYGILFEKDVDGKMLPTCCLPEIESFLDDHHYKKACDLADMESAAWYEKTAEYIERVRRTWLEHASKREPYDIFISYKESDREQGIDRTEDSIRAHDLYSYLRDQGYRVFYSRLSLRDAVGEKYEPYIFHALNTAKVMIVYSSTPDYVKSTWMKNEWQRYNLKLQRGEKQHGSLLIICDGFSPSELPPELQDIQAFDGKSVTCYPDLFDCVKDFVINGAEEQRLAEEERQKQEVEEQKKREEETRRLNEAMVLARQTSDDKKQRKRGKKEKDGTEFIRHWKIFLSILLPLVLGGFVVLFALLWEVPKPWFVGISMSVAYLVLVIWIHQLFMLYKGDEDDLMWTELVINIIVGAIAIILPWISREFSIYAICFVAAVIVLSLIILIMSKAEMFMSGVTALVAAFVMLLPLHLFLSKWGPSDYVIKDGVLKDYFGSEEVVVIPDGVTEIGAYAFHHELPLNNVQKVILPDSVEIIGYGAFWECDELSDVVFSDNLRSIGEMAFEDTYLRKLVLPSKVTYIGANAFPTVLEEITLPEGLAEIEANAFKNTSIKEIVIPDSVRILGAYCFDGCESLTTVYLGSGLERMGNTLFKNTNIKTIYYNGTEEDWDNIVKKPYEGLLGNQGWDHEAGNYELVFAPVSNREPAVPGEVISRPVSEGCASTINDMNCFIILPALLSACTLLTIRRRRKGEA